MVGMIALPPMDTSTSYLESSDVLTIKSSAAEKERIFLWEIMMEKLIWKIMQRIVNSVTSNERETLSM